MSTHTGSARVEQDRESGLWQIVVYPSRRAASQNIVVVTPLIYRTSKAAEPDWNEVSQMLDYGVEPHEVGSLLYRRSNPCGCGGPCCQRKNPADWLQAADAEIEAHGTEGAFTRQARRAGYTDTLSFARMVKEDYQRWVALGKPGRAPYTLKTYRRATFALNAQKRRRNPMTRKLRNPDDYDRQWTKGNNAGDGYAVGDEEDDINDLADEVGGTLIQVSPGHGVAVYRRDDGSLVAVGDAYGPWAVDL